MARAPRENLVKSGHERVGCSKRTFAFVIRFTFRMVPLCGHPMPTALSHWTFVHLYGHCVALLPYFRQWALCDLYMWRKGTYILYFLLIFQGQNNSGNEPTGQNKLSQAKCGSNSCTFWSPNFIVIGNYLFPLKKRGRALWPYSTLGNLVLRIWAGNHKNPNNTLCHCKNTSLNMKRKVKSLQVIRHMQ